MRSALITLMCLAVTLLVQESYQISSLYCPCLKTTDSVLPIARIKSYTRQRRGVCHVDAIVFKTVKGKTVCADPKEDWVQVVMDSLDKKKATPRPKTTAQPMNSTFNATSMPNTTSHLHTTNTNTKTNTTGQTRRLFTTLPPC